jgi:hypothetical protein
MAGRKKQDTMTRSLFTQGAPQRPPTEPFAPGPNPRLLDYVQQHATPYEPAKDEYDVPAFDLDCQIDNAAEPKNLFDLHFYKGKKHWTAIREHIRHYLPARYYPKGTGLVLDCFSGSGMTGVAAMLEGHRSILIDASPAAAFISHCYTHPVVPDQILAAYETMLSAEYPDELKAKLKRIAGKDISNLQQEIDWLFETKCERCGGSATTEYVVYSERFLCPKCGQLVALYDCPSVMVEYEAGSAKKIQKVEKKRNVCPHCLKEAGRPRKEFVISTRTKKHGSVPVLISYVCQGECKPKRGHRRHDDARNTRKGRFFADYDMTKLTVIEKMPIPHWCPERKMMDVEDDNKPWGMECMRPTDDLLFNRFPRG